MKPSKARFLTSETACMSASAGQLEKVARSCKLGCFRCRRRDFRRVDFVRKTRHSIPLNCVLNEGVMPVQFRMACISACMDIGWRQILISVNAQISLIYNSHLSETMSRYLSSIVMRTIMVVSSGYDLSAFHHYRPESEAHWTLCCHINTLRQIKLRLVHNCTAIDGMFAGFTRVEESYVQVRILPKSKTEIRAWQIMWKR